MHELCVADDEPLGQNEPAWQVPAGCDAPEGQYTPAGHSTCVADDDALGQYEPLWHAACVGDDEPDGQ